MVLLQEEMFLLSNGEAKLDDERVREEIDGFVKELEEEEKRKREEFSEFHKQLEETLGDDWERLEGALSDIELLEKEVIDTA